MTDSNQVSGSKRWYQSKTVIAGATTFVVGALGLVGYVVPEADQQIVSDAVLALITAVSGIVAVYGRAKATKSIK